MEHSIKYKFFMDPLTHIKDIRDTEKTKISVVYHNELKTSCILRICKNRDLSAIYNTLKDVQNPNTVFVHDFVYENGDTYILEEFLSGSTVYEIMEDKGTFSERSTAKIIIEVCKALKELHKKKPPVVHNDINTSNIRIREDGSVKLFDFDISRVYKKGQNQNTVLFGTEEYASPEHFGYGQSEPRTDIYCLGVTMHIMLTGKSLSSEHKGVYNGKLKNIIKKCIEVDPQKRFSSVDLLQKKLEVFLHPIKKIIVKLLILMTILIVSLALLDFVYWEWILHNSDYEDNSVIQSEISDIQMHNTEATGDDTNYAEDWHENANNYPNTDQTETYLNDSRETAWGISFEQKQKGTCVDSKNNWYKFSSRGSSYVYRIAVNPIEAPSNALFPYLCISIYDSIGVKLEEFDVWSDDEYGFIDVCLESNNEYFIKIECGGRFSAASYEICVSEKICDAGINKYSATELNLAERCIANLDSTLSDWYVFKIPKNGEYTYTIHNINVGCDIYFSKQQPRSAGEGNSVENEDNYSGIIHGAQEGESVYFEIYPYNKNPKANGEYIIVIEEVGK